MNTFYQMWGVTVPEEAKAKIEEQKAEAMKNMRFSRDERASKSGGTSVDFDRKRYL